MPRTARRRRLLSRQTGRAVPVEPAWDEPGDDHAPPLPDEPADAPPPAVPAALTDPTPLAGPLPAPLPPPLDAAVRALRDDLLDAGGTAAALADEICARHRDRLRTALGWPTGE